MIELDQVCVEVQSGFTGEAPTRILGPITATLEQRRISVIGANGSGKSTLLRTFNALVPPSSGSIRVNGLALNQHVGQVRGQLGFIFSDPAAQLVMPTVQEDVELSLRPTISSRAQRRSRSLEVLDSLGLGHLAGRAVVDLSSGQRQLVALASVLASQPKIVVADEPTTLLDLANTTRLRTLFASAAPQIIFSTHDLDFALDAQRTLVILEGVIKFDGEPRAAVEFYRGTVAQAQELQPRQEPRQEQGLA